jgi:hypothetical protein
MRNHTIQQFVGLLGAILMRKKQAEAEAKARSLIMKPDYVDMGVHENSCDLCRTTVMEIGSDGFALYALPGPEYGRQTLSTQFHVLLRTTPLHLWSDDLLYQRIRREMGQSIHSDCTLPYYTTYKHECRARDHDHVEVAQKLWEFRAHRTDMVQNTIQQFVGLMAAIKVRRDCVLNQSKHK